MMRELIGNQSREANAGYMVSLSPEEEYHMIIVKEYVLGLVGSRCLGGGNTQLVV